MVKEILVNEYIEEAINLINTLDNNNIKVDSALWYYFEEAEEWRFIIATPIVDEKGLFEAYKIIGDIIKKNNIFYYTPLNKLTLMSPSDPLIKLLKHGVKTGPKLAKIRFQNNFINNVFIEDALIYRL